MSKSISICLTAYNEESNIQGLRERLDSIISSTKEINEIVIVNNASNDNTHALLEDFSFSVNYKLLNLTENLGYGSGMKAAIKASTNDLVCLIHADDQYSYQDIKRVIKSYLQVTNQSVIIVKGKRFQRTDPVIIRCFSFVNSFIVSLLSGKIIQDANGIPKLFKKSNLSSNIDLLPNNASLDGALLISLLRNKGCVEEIPVHYYDRTHGNASWSAGKFKVAISMTIELFRFKFKTEKK